MRFNPTAGTYVNGELLFIPGSFQINTTNDPDVIRDGKSTVIKSVTRVSAGLFEVTLDTGFPVPERFIAEFVSHSCTATPTKVPEAKYVVGSWSQSTRKFRIVTEKVADTGWSAYTDPLPDDPDDNDRVSFLLIGCINSVGVDPA